MKVLLVSSSGGHYSELKKIKLDSKHEIVTVTEKIKDIKYDCDYYLKYGSRTSMFKYFFIAFFNTFKALYIILKEKPKFIISTGAHTCVPFFYIAKILNIKTIYIESYAKVEEPSLTYKIIKNVSTKVIVQHESLIKKCNDASYFGGIY